MSLVFFNNWALYCKYPKFQGNGYTTGDGYSANLIFASILNAGPL